jgi:tetratricopeptide (TPR) repeat protein
VKRSVAARRRGFGAARAAGILAAAVASLWLVLAGGAARADRLDEAWKRANDAYFKGDYASAVAAYEQIERQDVISADLYYNLGVAYFRLGSLGRAIWAFERAAALDPDAEDARFNLTQARKLAERRTRDKIEGAERDPAWIRLVTSIPTSTQTWLFVSLYLGVFALLFLRRRASVDTRAPLSAGAAILAFATLLAGLVLVGRVALDQVPFAIVLPDSVAVKEGADPNYRTSFDLHAGLRVRLLEQDHDWVKIRLANGLEGWVRMQDLGRL